MSINKEDFMKQAKICERAEKMFPKLKKTARINYLMDLESATQVFNLRLDDFLAADDENFAHDFLGIINNSNRETYPCTFENHFLPRFAGR